MSGVRNVDYVLGAPVPFAPLTRVGLRAMATRARDGFEQLEALHALDQRRNDAQLAATQPAFLVCSAGSRRARHARTASDSVRPPLSLAALDRAILRMETAR